jgi:hypothetical protein
MHYSKDRRNLKGGEIDGYFPQESLGRTRKGKVEEKASEDSKWPLSEYSVRRVRSDQRAGPERVLEVSCDAVRHGVIFEHNFMTIR